MADPKVLEAQQWVNSTYGDVSGYQPCDEDGFTGWQTIYSLIMGLQHELGISPVAAAFGPATLSRLTSHGDITTAEDNENIIDIARHAFWCKGYYGGYTQGAWDQTMVDAVRSLRQDVGLPYQSGADLVITPKLFKAMLTMDAHVLTAGGSQESRQVQQWLNSRYVNRSTFFLIPCDGHFSRGVQQALVRAIQYEIGIPDDQANGNFGDQTKAGLRNHPVSQGSSGVWVQLFSGACVFNGAVGDATATFTSSFDGDLADWVRTFQAFSALAVNGRGDYQTWAQLLVSTGDPDRPVNACDTSRTITAPMASALHAEGFRYVGRYLANVPGGMNKMIQPGELEAIFGAGLRVFPIWQMVGSDAHYFTHVTGREHAYGAHVAAEQTHGFDRGTVLYFAVDYDATDEEIDAYIIPYFLGVQNMLSSLGRRYRAGVYGSRNVCARVGAAAFTNFSFVSGMSYGFSGNLGFPLPPNWSFNQIKEIPAWSGGGQTIPLDRVAHRPGSDAGQSRVRTGSSPVTGVIDYVRQVYDLAVAYGTLDPNVRVMEYLRQEKYNDWRFNHVLGAPDQEWLSYAEERLPYRAVTYLDPAHGVVINLDHFAATTDGHYSHMDVGQTDVDFGDFGGWGGDLISFYAQWRSMSSEYGSGYDFCMDRMCVIGVSSLFGLGDMIEDADGFFFAKTLRANQVSFPDLLAMYLNAWYSDRFTTFVTQRWGNFINLTAAAKKLLTSLTIRPDLIAFREGLIQMTEAGAEPPQILPNDKIDQFIAGFHDTLVRLAQTS